MKAVSISTDGTSGDLSTMKLARPTCGLCMVPVRFIAPNMSPATLLLASRVALCERSSNTDASMSSLSFSVTPPTRSEAFSLSAKRRANSLLAPLGDKTNTELPRTLRLVNASA